MVAGAKGQRVPGLVTRLSRVTVGPIPGGASQGRAVILGDEVCGAAPGRITSLIADPRSMRCSSRREFSCRRAVADGYRLNGFTIFQLSSKESTPVHLI